MKYKELQQFSQEVFSSRACFSETYQRTRKGKREIVRKKNRENGVRKGAAIGAGVGVGITALSAAASPEYRQIIKNAFKANKLGATIGLATGIGSWGLLGAGLGYLNHKPQEK